MPDQVRETMSQPAPVNPFAFRLGVPSDLPSCLPALRPGDPARSFQDAELVRLWQRCLGHGAFVVIERIGKARLGTIEGFGLSVFVPDVFADRYFTDPRPGVTLEFFRGLGAGEPVLLSEPQVAQANAGPGINVLVLHFGSRLGDFSDPQTLALHALVGSSFYFSHGGHRIRSILAETYGPDATRYAEEGQFRLLKDFACATPAAYADVPVQERPHLVGLRRDWVLGAGWYPMAQLFSSVMPRIHFSRTERRVLERAMLGEPDQVIADALGLSSHTVKSAWKHAIQRAGDTIDGLFPGGSSRDTPTRGREKRIYLLTYLREHMEELRPYPRSRAQTGARVQPRR
jgi:DNA-binding CsgD family transcriptional regulator